MSDDKKVIFSMQGISKVYPPQKQVLKDIYLSFFYGAKIGIIGLNGSGKSTLLKIILHGETIIMERIFTKHVHTLSTHNTLPPDEPKIISFIERDQRPVIERILRGHQSGAMVGGLWAGPIRTLANQRGPPSNSERDPDEPRELQLVLDPEFL